MDDPLSGIVLAGIGLLTLAIFLLSLSEAALVAVSRVRLRRRQDEGDRAAGLVLDAIETPDFISAIIVAINVFVITISGLATFWLHRREQEGAGLGEQAVHLIILGVILVFAEITPKNIGAAYPTAVSRWVVRPVMALSWLLGPVVAAARAAGNLALRGVGVELLNHGHFVTKEDLEAAVAMGEEEDVLDSGEGEMFDSALGLSATLARKIMVPRVDVVALDRTASMDEALEAIQDSGFSRIPVYDGDIDNVVGILYANDLLKCLRAGTCEGQTAGDFPREAMVIPDRKPVDELFREMREQKVHIALVIDEQGGTEGIVTIEDILEEIVGDIEDEHDTPGEEIRLVSENEALVSPKARIDDVNEAMATSIPTGDYETIGGFIAGETGRIPDHGETIRLDGIEVTVQGDAEEPLLRVCVLTDQSEGGES